MTYKPRFYSPLIVAVTIAVIFSSLQSLSAASVDPRITANPLLSEVYRESPELANSTLREIDRLLANRDRNVQLSAPKTAPRFSTGNPETDSAFQQNPILNEVWRADPQAALDLLKRLQDSKAKN